METRLYNVRWLLLAALFLIKSLNTITFAGSGLINNFYVSYFQVSHAAVDWVVLSAFVGSVLTTPVVATLAFFNLLPFRRMVILSALLLAAVMLSFVLALLSNRLFFLTVLSQIVSGVPASINEILPGIFATLWFPESQVGTAIGAIVFGTSFGNVIGAIALTHAVKVTVSHRNNITQNDSVNITKTVVAVLESRVNLIITYCSLFAISFIILLFLIKYAEDLPPLPPTTAQSLKRKSEFYTRTNVRLEKVLSDSWKLISDWTFVIACVVFAIEYHISTFEYTLLGEMLRQMNSRFSFQQSTVISGYTVTCFSGGACAGCILSGFLTNRYKHYSRQTIVGCLISFVASLGILFGFEFGRTWLLMLSNAVYGMATRISMVPLYDLITQHTYPINETISCGWMTCVQVLLAVVAAELSRLLFTYTGSLGVLIFHSGALLFNMLLVFLIKPKYGRLLLNS